MIKQQVLEARGARFTARCAGEGPLVMLLHGFPDTPASFDGLIEGLARAGLQAVAPTLRGYERSSLDGPRRVPDLVADLLAQAEVLGAERVHLVGHDWGAAVAYAAGALAPERLGALVTLAVPHLAGAGRALAAHPEQLARSAYMLRFSVGGEGSLARGRVRALWRRWWGPGEPPAALVEAAEAALSDREIARAALSYYRQLSRPGAAEVWRLLMAEVRAPTLAIVGEDDGCISARAHGLAMVPARFPAGLRRVVLAEAGHWPHLSRPEATLDLIRGAIEGVTLL